MLLSERGVLVKSSSRTHYVWEQVKCRREVMQPSETKVDKTGDLIGSSSLLYEKVKLYLFIHLHLFIYLSLFIHSSINYMIINVAVSSLI